MIFIVPVNIKVTSEDLLPDIFLSRRGFGAGGLFTKLPLCSRVSSFFGVLGGFEVVVVVVLIYILNFLIT
jgi:hypothetical protein